MLHKRKRYETTEEMHSNSAIWKKILEDQQYQSLHKYWATLYISAKTAPASHCILWSNCPHTTTSHIHISQNAGAQITGNDMVDCKAKTKIAIDIMTDSREFSPKCNAAKFLQNFALKIAFDCNKCQWVQKIALWLQIFAQLFRSNCTENPPITVQPMLLCIILCE